MAAAAARTTRMRLSFSAISISVRPVSFSTAASARIASGSNGMRVMRSFQQEVRHGGQRQRVAADAETADHADGGLRDVGVLTEFLAPVDVGDVHLDHRQVGRQQRVHQRDRGGGVAGGIDHDALGAAAAFLHPGDQLALAVGLAEVDGEPELVGGFRAELLHVVERGAAVKLRLAQARACSCSGRSARRPGAGMPIETLGRA